MYFNSELMSSTNGIEGAAVRYQEASYDESRMYQNRRFNFFDNPGKGENTSWPPKMTKKLRELKARRTQAIKPDKEFLRWYFENFKRNEKSE